MSKKILIIGATTAARLRRLSEEDEIVILEKQDYISYSSCQLPYFIENQITEVNDLLVIERDEFEKNRNIKVKYNSEVISIDRNNKSVVYLDIKNNEKKTETYDYLVYALGSKAKEIDLSGFEQLKSINYLKTIDDAIKIKQEIQKDEIKNVCILGAGFIGLELAEALTNLNVKVTLVDQKDQLFNNADIEMSKFIESIYDKKGVRILLNSSAKGFNSEKIIVNNKEVDCDMLIVAVGVTPNTTIAKNAGIELNEYGEIIVNKSLQTSDNFIYSGGDCAITENVLTGQKRATNLAWVSNRQGRIIADNINNHKIAFKGIVGTSIIKIFDFTFASFGVSEKEASKLNIENKSIHIRRANHSENLPGSYAIFMKLTFNPSTRKILGCQIFGKSGVDKRIDIISTVAKLGGTIDDLPDIEVAYAPHYSAPKDAVNILGYVAANVADKKYDVWHCNEVENNCQKENINLLDVRTHQEYISDHFNNAKNIEYGDLRNQQIDYSKDAYLNCGSGHRSYMALCTLKNKGYKGNLFNLSGGFALKKQLDYKNISTLENNEDKKEDVMKIENRIVDLSGLQCPGPIVKANKETKNMKEGESITFKTDDLSFEPDIKAWSEKNGFQFNSSHIEKGELFVTISKSSLLDNSVSNSNNSRSRSIIVFSNDLDKVMASLIVANGALASGEKVHLFFTFWGLSLLRNEFHKNKSKKSILERMFSFMLPKGTRKLKLSKMNMLGAGTFFYEKNYEKKECIFM